VDAETLKAMKEAAAKATPGPWRIVSSNLPDDWGVTESKYDKGEHQSIAQMLWEDDARFLAECNPANVSALIAEVERLLASRRVHELDNHHNALACGYCSGPLRDELLRLQAEVQRQTGELRDAHQWIQYVEEREAAVCPEDTPFDVYIKHLEARLNHEKESTTSV
jgi:Ead/Ea22-like protein